MYESKRRNAVYVSKKCCKENHYDLLLILEEDKRHYVLIEDFNILMYDIFCHFSVQAINTEETLKHHIKGCFKINGKRRIESPKQGEYVRLRNLERKTVLKAGGVPVAEDNGKQNPDECCTNIYEENFMTTNMQKVMDAD